MLKELFMTDVGLLSLAVIVIAVLIGGVMARFLIRNAAGDGDRRR